MGKIKDLIHNINIPTPVYFIVAILLIVVSMPRENRVKYTYELNKPWRYGLLTARFDFHIEKSKERVEIEKDSVLKSFLPYFFKDTSVQVNTSNQFKLDARAKSIPRAYIDFVTRKMAELYKAGIISADNNKRFTDQGKTQVRLRDDIGNIAQTRHLSSFYTPKTAYQEMLSSVPSYLDIGELKSINIGEYLLINIFSDEKTSAKATDVLLQQIPLYEGMIQSGEKIIDRGEIVDSKTFDILNSYVYEGGGRIGPSSKIGWVVMGQALCVSLLVFLFIGYLRFFRKREYKSKKSIVFILAQICIFVLLTSIAIRQGYPSLLFVIPFAIPVILIRTFIDSRTAMLAHSLTVIICSLIVPQPIVGEFIFMQFIVGMVTILSLTNLSERSQLIYTGIIILLTYILTYTAWLMCIDGGLSQLEFKLYLYFCVNFIFITFSYLLVYVCERMFGFISEVTMIELSNINKPLLQRLSETAPGTFQHSMQVSNLAAAVALRLGANAALVRTGGLYHDIGKMRNPAFFTENQSQGMNPHAGLSYKESARIIISHVEEGVKIANKYNLPQQIIDFIETHHGKGKARFFYNSFKNENPDIEIDDNDFTYPGPNPFTKETAILMMADIVEAASRSLPEYTEKSITQLVNKLIDIQVNDGLLKNAPITFSDIKLAKEIFCEKLITIYHSRIAYPKLDTDEISNTKNH